MVEVIGLLVGLCTLLGFLGKLIMTIGNLNHTEYERFFE